MWIKMHHKAILFENCTLYEYRCEGYLAYLQRGPLTWEGRKSNADVQSCCEITQFGDVRCNSVAVASLKTISWVSLAFHRLHILQYTKVSGNELRMVSKANGYLLAWHDPWRLEPFWLIGYWTAVRKTWGMCPSNPHIACTRSTDFRKQNNKSRAILFQFKFPRMTWIVSGPKTNAAHPPLFSI